MFYGAAVNGPMEIPRPPISPFREVSADLPAIADATKETLDIGTQLDKRLPALPPGSYANQDLSFMNTRAIEAQELMNDMRAAYEISRGYDRRNKAVAKARARQNDRKVKTAKSGGNRTRKKIQNRTKRMEKLTVLRNARDVLGMGTDLYR